MSDNMLKDKMKNEYTSNKLQDILLDKMKMDRLKWSKYVHEMFYITPVRKNNENLH